ncbi:MAG TPA: P-loop NTPase fold protein, partial [Actinophytocola sp.]|uniref:P-loop NTPase fold protein n=1 Tax=Actinophytocola sp. TaxID=1872138 RepID=UPI002E01BBC7|nr:P-loop NTPase fold protein [Actinophytocola sp.]
PHEDVETDLPTLRSVAAATEHAISMAAQAGVTAIGLPLLATGALGFPVAEVASVAIPAVKRALRSKEYPALESLVFICIDTTTAVAVRDAWNAPSSIDERTAAEQAPAPEPAGAKSAPPPQEFSDTELAGGLSSDLVKPNEGIPLARDNLGFAPYVSMLATVIADRQTPLPLSVGIFGEWGSGKRFFMGLLRNQVRALTESGSPAYCRRIDQIGFNAWHYADANLWASLGDEIFRQLAEPGPGVEMRRERLRVELAERLVERRQLEATTRQARVEAAALQASVDAAAASRESGARELIVALKRSDTAGKMLNQLWRRLGVADEIEQGKLLAEQMRGTLTEAEALRRAPWDRRGKIALAAWSLYWPAPGWSPSTPPGKACGSCGSSPRNSMPGCRGQPRISRRTSRTRSTRCAWPKPTSE